MKILTKFWTPSFFQLSVLAFLATFAGAAFAQTVSRDVSTEETSRAMAAVAKEGVKRAFLVGVDDYAEFADLKYAVADVEAIRARLLKLGFAEENIVVMTSQSKARLLPTRRNIERQLAAFLNAAGPNDLLFLHFSGHGFQADDVRFAPLDAVATNNERVVEPETTVSLTELVERLEAAKATRKILVVDACRENPTESRNAAATALALKNVDARPGVLVLQSCSAGELSREDAKRGRGLFTGRLLEALAGKADADGDDAISALEVCRYASNETLAASRTQFNASQTPRFNADVADFILGAAPQNVGPSDEDLERAEALYAAALESAQAKDFNLAQGQIAEALELVEDLQDDDLKQRYLERQATIERLSEFTPAGPAAAGDFVVSSTTELVAAMANAGPGSVVALEAGTYQLNGPLSPPTSLTLIGKSGDREKVQIIFEPQRRAQAAFILPDGVELTLTDLSLTADGCFVAAKSSVVKATRCNFYGSATKSAEGDYVFHECNVEVAGSRTSPPSWDEWVQETLQRAGLLEDGARTSPPSRDERLQGTLDYDANLARQRKEGKMHPMLNAAFPNSPNAFILNGGSLTAENCDFKGGITCPRLSLKNCAVHDCDAAIETWGGEIGALGNGDAHQVDGSCELIECRFYRADVGLNMAGAGFSATVKGCEFKEIEIGARVWQKSALTLNDVKFVDCSIGVDLGGDSGSGRCDATNVTFDNVKTKWNTQDSESSATLDGRPVAPANNRRYY
ncbi:MAG: caspase family protein [Thermoguttaceae bacterium]|nr:caspase family protein [Thermoguttaceae bacterium]